MNTRWFRKLESLIDGVVTFQNSDREFIGSQVSIALNAYKKQQLNHQGPLENVMGLLAELAYEEWLSEGLGAIRGKDYEWNERRADYWENDPRPWDFKLLKSGISFEIGAARLNHYMAVMKDSAHKKESTYFVQVQIRFFNAEIKVGDKWYAIDAGRYVPQEITNLESISKLENGAMTDIQRTIGKAKIRGYDKTMTICNQQNGWAFSRKGEKITPYANGYVKEIDALCPLYNLEALVKDALGCS